MNKNLYRIVFNKRRGQLMAVAETAGAQGKSASGETGRDGSAQSLAFVLRPLGFCISAALSMVLLMQPVARAQVVADPSASGSQRPTILGTANGLPQVNIQTPSAAGVSRNTYSQFDVQPGGVILNNSRVNVQTQLGGYVQANPWLAAGSARVILNEVNSGNPSQLRGYVEVAGQRAEVIIANPAGINVNGGGFINASGVTLTTGTPVINNGSLDAFRVQGGAVNVLGAGLDARTADYTHVLARAVQLNAGIWAKDLKVVTGANQVSADQGSAMPAVAPMAGTGVGPSFALDVAQLGGMYAGKIFLIGTESGIGMRNAGIVGATAGDVVLQSNGWLTNSGSIKAAGNTSITTAGSITNGSTGVVAAQGNTTLQATGAGAQISSAAGSVVAAGMVPDGSLTAGGKLSITAADSVTLNGQLVSSGDTGISGTKISLVDGKLSSQGLALAASNGDIDASRAKITAQGLLTATTAQTLRTDGAAILAGQLTLSADKLSNVAGEIVQAGTGGASITASGLLDNTGGRIASNGNVTLSANSLINRGGFLQTAGAADLNVSITGALDNSALNSPAPGTPLVGSQVTAGGNVTVSAGSVTNSGKLQAGVTLALSAATIANAVDAEISAATTKVSAGNALTNRGLIDGGITAINAVMLDNLGAGRIYGDSLSIAATTINNNAETVGGVTKTPVVAARNRLDIGANVINNGKGALVFSAGQAADALNIGGSLDANRQAAGFAGSVNNSGGTIESMGGLSIAAAQINNTNPDFAYTVQTASSSSLREYITGQGIFSGTDVAWIAPGSDQPNAASHGGYMFLPSVTPGSGFPVQGTNYRGDGHGKIVLANSPYASRAYQPYFGSPNAYTPQHSELDFEGGSYLVPDAFVYAPTDPIWQVFGMTAPAGAMPGPRPTGTNNGDFTILPTQQELDAWNASIAPWAALQAKLDTFRTTVNASAIAFEGYREYAQTTYTPVVTQSAPGRILSAGAMTLKASTALINDQSQIIAGGALNITGQAVDNRGRSTTVNAQKVGTDYSWSNYNEGCGGWGGCDYNYNAYRPVAYVQDVPQTLSFNVYRQDAMVSPASQGMASGTQLHAATTVGPVSLPTAPVITLPNSSLFHTNPNPAGGYLVETDPRFTNLRQWLGSDYMLATLSLDPTVTQKRLGDGFYEQRLINEQIAQLTGQRFLASYTSDEQQYRALMDAGITYAQAYKLRPGIALTAVQMAQLTSDIIWLIERDVLLPDGSITQALVPQVYIASLQPGDLNRNGALLAGREINLNLNGDLTNSGTIAGRTVVNLSAENVHNLGGRITGDAVTVAARTDLNNIGGQIDAASSLTALAGRDLNIVTTTSSATNQVGNNTFSQTGLDRVAGLYVTGQNGTLMASAGRDANIIAGVINNSGANSSTVISAGNNINLGTVTTSSSNAVLFDGDNFLTDGQSRDVGSQINAQGSLRLAAGNDLNAKAANVQAGGALTATAGNSVNITAGQSTSNFSWGMTTSESDLFSATSTKERKTSEQANAAGSSFGGNTVTIASGQDINVKGSSVISDTGTTLAAGRNLTLEAAQNTQSSSSFYEKKESGLLDGGGAGITIGSREQSTDQKNRSTSAAASTVGSIGGNVTLIAGEQYRQVGSDVLAPNGDITIVAKKVDIVEARETSRTDIEQKFKQSGITVAISNPVLSAVQTAQGITQAMGNTGDSRMQALGAAAIGLNGYNTYNSLTDKAGNFDADKAQGVSISLGSSKSQSNSTNQSDTARGSTVAAGHNVSITATGAGADSNLTVQGSSVTAGNNAILAADNQVKLLAAQNTASQSSTNSSSSGSIGVSLGSNTGVTLSASKGRGNSDGQDTSYTNTNITAGNTAIVQSGGDTNLKGAVVTANTVKANVGGNLNIESLQDTSTYNSQQSSAGGSITIGPGFIPTGGGISASNSHINSNFQSVNETSGIKAGDGGFQVNVNNNTDLKGAVIASTQAAVDNNKNSFQTGGTLSTSDIQNTANYNGSGYTVSASTGSGQDPKGNTIYMPGGGAGVASAQGSASSVTQSGISGIAGNTAVRTGDAETGIQKIFDAQKVQREMDAQMAITAAFGQQASRAVGDYAGQKLKDAIANKDQAEIDKWKEGGSARVALHALVGGLAGDLAGAAGAAASQSFIPMIGEEIAKLDIPVELKQALIAAAGTAIGATVGGAAGAASGFNGTVNNYLTATDIRSKAQKLLGCEANDDVGKCKVAVLIEYDLQNAKNSASINYKSVLSESALQGEKEQLERLLQDASMSDSAKAEARKSINELTVAINVIQKSPMLRDAAELGLIVADVALLGELAAAKALTSTVVKQFIAARTGKEITPDAAAIIANNFYRDGVASPQALATSSGVVIQAVPGKTTTVLGNYVADMQGIITEQTGIPKSMGYLEPKTGGFNVLNVPDDYAAALMKQNPEAFWNQVNKPFLDAAIQRGDELYLATKPDFRPMNSLGGGGNIAKADGTLTGFGREIEYLSERGYVYQPATGKMVKR